MMSRGSAHPLWRWAFVGYALLLVVLTHWPHLTIDVPIHRPDLLVHAGVFAGWTVLLERSGLLGRFYEARVLRWSRLAWWGVVAGGYAALDEWTQQFVGRVTAMDDLQANWIGIGLGLFTIVVFGVSQRRRGRRAGVVAAVQSIAPPDPVASHPPEQG